MAGDVPRSQHSVEGNGRCSVAGIAGAVSATQGSTVDVRSAGTMINVEHQSVVNNFGPGCSDSRSREGFLRSERLKPIDTWNLPFPSQHFVPRETLLETIKERLSRSPSSPQSSNQVVLTELHGLGGIGKTYLTAHVIHNPPPPLKYTFRGWFNVGMRATVESKDQSSLSPISSNIGQQYMELARELGIISSEAKVDEAILRLKQWFEQNPGWLLVFDDADEFSELKPFLPKRGGTILITSRRTDWDNTVPIDVMELDEAVLLLEKIIGRKDAQICELAEVLGRFPLALAQAGAYIKGARISLHEYLSIYKQQSVQLLEYRSKMPSGDEHLPVAVTWEISLRAIAEENSKSIELLNFCYYLNNIDIPRSLLMQALLDTTKSLNLMEFQGTLEPLLRYSMLTAIPDKDTVAVHPLVQEVGRWKVCPSPQKILIKLYQAIRTLYPWDKKTQADFDFTRTLIPHIEKLFSHYEELFSKEKSTLMEEIVVENELVIAALEELLADAYGALGDAHKEKELLERALVIEERRYGKEHVEVAINLGNLGNAYGALGDAHKQKELLERALEILERHYGKEHVEVARTLVNLGNAYGALGDAHKQKELLERALVIEERHYGKEHVVVAITLVNLGNAYSALGDAHKQKELLERSLEILERHYGKEHVGVAITLVNLGNAYGALGDTHKQKELLERALVIKGRYYGKKHVEVARILADLGCAYGALGDTEKKKELLERALVIFERHYSKEHVVVAITLGNLGNAYGALGDTHKQKELLERALVIKERYYGKKHVEVARILADLGCAYGALGDAEKQKELLERVLVIEERHYGKEHVEVAKILANLGCAYGALGDAHKQKELLERALVIEERHYGKEHVEVARTLFNLGNAYGALGDARKQKELLERALVIEEKRYGKEHVEVARTLFNLGNSYGALGDARKQKELLERALVIEERHYGKEHVEVAGTLVNLGNAYGALGDTEKKKELLERALVIFERHYGKEHVEVARTLGNLGNAYGALGDARKQKELLERALEILERHHGKEHVEVAIDLGNLGNAYGALGDAHKGKELLEGALVILERYYGKDHVAVARTLVNLGCAYGTLGDAHKQKELLERVLQITLGNLGNAYLMAGSFNEAIIAYETYLKRVAIYQATVTGGIMSKENVAGAYHNLGRVYHLRYLQHGNSADLREAEAAFQKAIEIYPIANKYVEYGVFLVEQRRFTNAYSVLQNILRMQDDKSELSYSRLEKSRLNIKLQQEVDRYGKIRISANLLGYYLLTRCCMELKKPDEVSDYMKLFSKQAKQVGSELAYRLLGHCHEYLVGEEKAEQCFTQALPSLAGAPAPSPAAILPPQPSGDQDLPESREEQEVSFTP